MLAAQWKAGKSTTIGNLVRALADDQPFLDRFEVQHSDTRVALIDNELDERTLRRWLADQDVKNPDRVQLVPLRGKVATFDLLDPQIRSEWATDLAAVDADVVLLDCLRPVLDALGLDENHEAGRFLVAFDTLLAEAGVTEALVVHHMGHTGERSRGDSRIMDWPDALWTLVRDKDDEATDGADDPAGARYFSAYGRDVDYPQVELSYDPVTRRLSIGNLAPNRRQATENRRMEKARQAVLAAITQTPGIGKVKLRTACRSLGVKHNPDVDEAIELLLEDDRVFRRQVGPRHEYYLSDRSEQLNTANVPNGAQPCPGHGGQVGVPSALKGLGTPPLPYPDPDDPADESGHIQPDTKPCPEGCGNQIPEHHVRCGACTHQLMHNVRSNL